MKIPIYLRVALALELLLAAIECAFPRLHGILPIGGSVMAQTGVLICVCYVIHELWESWKDSRESADSREGR